MACRQPTPRELMAIEMSADVSNAAGRIGITNSSLQGVASFEPLPQADFPATGVDLSVLTPDGQGGTSTDFFSAEHYVCAFNALGLGESATAGDTATLQRQVRHFSGSRLAQDRLRSGLGILEVVEYFRRDPTSNLGGLNTDDNSNHISPAEWNAFIDARMALEPNLPVSTQVVEAPSEEGDEEESQTLVRYETDTEKRTRISQREWRHLENFIRFVRYYNNDQDMKPLITRFTERDVQATRGYEFFTTISQGLATRPSSVSVWNYQTRRGNRQISLAGLSEYLVPADDPNREVCANTNGQQLWPAITQACNAIIWTANQRAVERQAYTQAVVAQRDQLVTTVDSHRFWERVGGGILGAGIVVGGALLVRRTRTNTIREMEGRIRAEVEAEMRVGLEASLGGIRRHVTEAKSEFGRSTPRGAIINDNLRDALTHLEAAETAIQPSTTSPTVSLGRPAATATRAVATPFSWTSPSTWRPVRWVLSFIPPRPWW